MRGKFEGLALVCLCRKKNRIIQFLSLINPILFFPSFCMIVLAETPKQKGGYMNSITNLLDLEDTDIEITDIQIQDQTKTLTLSTPPVPHFCPSCGFRMYSRGIKKRTINHPILQDNYSLVLILKQRRWRCTNPECLYDTSESFKFVNRQRRTINATDMLIVDAYRNLLETSVSIAKNFMFLILMHMMSSIDMLN